MFGRFVRLHCLVQYKLVWIQMEWRCLVEKPNGEWKGNVKTRNKYSKSKRRSVSASRQKVEINNKIIFIGFWITYRSQESVDYDRINIERSLVTRKWHLPSGNRCSSLKFHHRQLNINHQLTTSLNELLKHERFWLICDQLPWLEYRSFFYHRWHHMMHFIMSCHHFLPCFELSLIKFSEPEIAWQRFKSHDFLIAQWETRKCGSVHCLCKCRRVNHPILLQVVCGSLTVVDVLRFIGQLLQLKQKPRSSNPTRSINNLW